MQEVRVRSDKKSIERIDDSQCALEALIDDVPQSNTGSVRKQAIVFAGIVHRLSNVRLENGLDKPAREPLRTSASTVVKKTRVERIHSVTARLEIDVSQYGDLVRLALEQGGAVATTKERTVTSAAMIRPARVEFLAPAHRRREISRHAFDQQVIAVSRNAERVNANDLLPDQASNSRQEVSGVGLRLEERPIGSTTVRDVMPRSRCIAAKLTRQGELSGPVDGRNSGPSTSAATPSEIRRGLAIDTTALVRTRVGSSIPPLAPLAHRHIL